MQATLPHHPYVVPVEISAVDWEYGQNRLHYQQLRQAKALKLRRQLVRRRTVLKRRLSKVLSPGLLVELNIRVVLDNHYLHQPDFVGVFEDGGLQWTIGFQAKPFGGRWFFKSSASSRLYSCSYRHLETQLCYALGQCRSHASALACA